MSHKHKHHPDSPASEQPASQTQPAASLEQLQSELASSKDRELRSHAELENYRKRADRQIEEERRFANIGLFRDLLPVLDNVHRAIEAAEKSSASGPLLDGVKLVADQLEGVLKCHHCVPIEALDKPFDPHLHQAIAHHPSPDHPADTVMMVTQTGFQLHGRVVRPSLVIVSAGNPAQEAVPDQPATSEEPSQGDGQP